MNHNQTALLGDATDRFKRTYLMVSRPDAGFKSPSLESRSRAVLVQGR